MCRAQASDYRNEAGWFRRWAIVRITSSSSVGIAQFNSKDQLLGLLHIADGLQIGGIQDETLDGTGAQLAPPYIQCPSP